MRNLVKAPMILALLLLTGCGAEKGSPADELARALRTEYLAAESVSATAEVTADYGETIYQYSLRLEGAVESGQLTLLAPQEIAGASVHWVNDGTTLSYDGVTLETGELSPDGLSPTDGIPLILSAIETGGIEESYLDTLGEEDYLVVQISNPDPDYSQESRITIWANPENYSLERASISWEGTEVLRFTFQEFSLNP